jgi:aldose 1-epimerase
MDLITLRGEPLGVVLAPAVGGSIARFWSEGARGSVELLRPASDAALRDRDPAAMASFPLVPWSNRIREGRFTFGSRAVSLPPHPPRDPHTIHGHGYRAAWSVLKAGSASAVLEHRHAPDAWPWAYRAVQHVELTATTLRLQLLLTNESDAAMPAGLGWHPYYPRTPETTLTASVAALWLTDAEILPVARVAPTPDLDLRRGLAVDRVALDNAFVGWDGRALISWPDRGAQLRLDASDPLNTLVVYTPPGQPFFCAEPVSHITDAFNLAAAGRDDTGMLSLQPGETVRAILTLTPEIA